MTPGRPVRRVVCLCLATFAVPALLTGAAQRAVKTDAGSLSGVSGAGGVTAYLGIPYAAPPVGDLRWRPPQPAVHWTGVRKADHFGASCMQNEAGSRLPWTEEFMTQGPISEDCLFLNVWTPASNATARLPVMVWIYGGGFTEGSSSVAVYNGATLARKGVLIVSLNYRVGPIGFLTYPELSQESAHHVSGNYGLLDEIAALQWVHANIAGFGGDPAKVTIFGQSAGALSVADLMQSSLSAGLFARAIAESGPGLIGGNTRAGSRHPGRARSGGPALRRLERCALAGRTARVAGRDVLRAGCRRRGRPRGGGAKRAFQRRLGRARRSAGRSGSAARRFRR